MNITDLQQEKARHLRILTAIDLLIVEYSSGTSQDAPTVGRTIRITGVNVDTTPKPERIAKAIGKMRGMLKRQPADAPKQETGIDQLIAWIDAQKGNEWTSDEAQAAMAGKMTRSGVSAALWKLKSKGHIFRKGWKCYQAYGSAASAKEQQWAALRESMHIKPVPEVSLKSPDGRAADVAP